MPACRDDTPESALLRTGSVLPPCGEAVAHAVRRYGRRCFRGGAAAWGQAALRRECLRDGGRTPPPPQGGGPPPLGRGGFAGGKMVRCSRHHLIRRFAPPSPQGEGFAGCLRGGGVLPRRGGRSVSAPTAEDGVLPKRGDWPRGKTNVSRETICINELRRDDSTHLRSDDSRLFLYISAGLWYSKSDKTRQSAVGGETNGKGIQ